MRGASDTFLDVKVIGDKDCVENTNKFMDDNASGTPRVLTEHLHVALCRTTIRVRARVCAKPW